MEPREFPDELSPDAEHSPARRRTPQQKDTARSAFLQFVCYSSNLKQLHSCAAPRSGRAKSFRIYLEALEFLFLLSCRYEKQRVLNFCNDLL
jgi:hypothetical protein